MSAYLTPDQERDYLRLRKQAEKDLEEATYSHKILDRHFIHKDIVHKTKFQNELAETYWMRQYVREARRIYLLEDAVKEYNDALQAHYQFLYEYRSQMHYDPSIINKPLVQQSLF